MAQDAYRFICLKHGGFYPEYVGKGVFFADFISVLAVLQVAERLRGEHIFYLPHGVVVIKHRHLAGELAQIQVSTRISLRFVKPVGAVEQVGIGQSVGKRGRFEVQAQLPEIVVEVFQRVCFAVGELEGKRFAEFGAVVQVEMDFHGEWLWG